MDHIIFNVPGQPQGKARARTFYDDRLQRMRSITPENTVLYENLIKMSFKKEACNDRFSDKDYLRVLIAVYYKIPKSTSRKKTADMIAGRIMPDKKPDIDNVTKCILDALNGVAYRDDSQVIELQAKKLYGADPMVQVMIERIVPAEV